MRPRLTNKLVSSTESKRANILFLIKQEDKKLNQLNNNQPKGFASLADILLFMNKWCNKAPSLLLY